MRVLIVDHGPLAERDALVDALTLAGCAVRSVVVSAARPSAESARHARFVVCGDSADADVPIAIPWFERTPETRTVFADLSDHELNFFRHALRNAVYEEVDAFDPRIVHARQLGILSHVALESGVPYVAQVAGPELSAAAADTRLARFIDESAENAGRLLVRGEARMPSMAARYPEAADRLRLDLLADAATADPRAWGEWLVSEYRAVLADRFGASRGGQG